jgi:magnesium transporter
MAQFQTRPPILLEVNLIHNPETEPEPAAASETVVDCAVYCDGERLPGTYTHETALAEVRKLEQGGLRPFVWIGLHEPDDEQMQSVAEVYGLHPLSVEDAVNAHQRPKVERYDDILFLVLKTVKYVPHESMALAREIVETGEIMVFIGPDFAVTVRHGDHTGLAVVRRQLEENPERLKLGPPAVMHAIADHVVDSYRSVSEAMETDVDAIEEEGAAGGAIEAPDGVHHGALAGAAGAHDGDELAGEDGQVDAAHGVHLDFAGLVGLAEVGELDDGLHGGSGLAPGPTAER